MGTNYYLIRTDMPKEEYQKKQETPEIHIGKSSYAGAYCNDCGITLVCEDATQVHDDTISDYQGGGYVALVVASQPMNVKILRHLHGR